MQSIIRALARCLAVLALGAASGASAQQAITLQTEDAVKYEVLVKIIDSCIGSELPAISVSPAAG